MTLRKNQPKMSEKSWACFTTGRGRVILPASQLARVHSSIASSSMQGASTAASAGAASASAIRTRGANCAGLESAGRRDTAEVPRDRVYPEAEPAKSNESAVVRSMAFLCPRRSKICAVVSKNRHKASGARAVGATAVNSRRGYRANTPRTF